MSAAPCPHPKKTHCWSNPMLIVVAIVGGVIIGVALTMLVIIRAVEYAIMKGLGW